jgi:hypothetical protein
MPPNTTRPEDFPPSKLEVELMKLEEGVLEHFPEGVSLTFGAEILDRAQIRSRLSGWIETLKAVALAKEGHRDAVAVRRAMKPEARAFQKALNALLKRHFGPDNPLLEAFGIPAEKPLPLSEAHAALAAARQSLTRAHRRAVRLGWREPLLAAGGPATPMPPSSDPEAHPPELLLLWSEGDSPASAPAPAPESPDHDPHETSRGDLPWVE